MDDDQGNHDAESSIRSKGLAQDPAAAGSACSKAIQGSLSPFNLKASKGQLNEVELSKTTCIKFESKEIEELTCGIQAARAVAEGADKDETIVLAQTLILTLFHLISSRNHAQEKPLKSDDKL